MGQKSIKQHHQAPIPTELYELGRRGGMKGLRAAAGQEAECLGTC